MVCVASLHTLFCFGKEMNMEIEKSPTKQHYDENAKRFVLNMKNNSRKLHIKNGCQQSTFLSEYYDFDTLEQVVKSFVSHTRCKRCFTEQVVSELEKEIEQQRKDKPILFFYIIVAICFGIIGFKIMNERVVGKVFGGVLFAAIGVVIAFFVDLAINLTYRAIYMAKNKVGDAEVAYKAYRKSNVALIVKMILCVLLIFLTITINFANYHRPDYKNQHKDYSDGDYYENYDYDNDGEINQNEWEDALGDYMDSIMD